MTLISPSIWLEAILSALSRVWDGRLQVWRDFL